MRGRLRLPALRPFVPLVIVLALVACGPAGGPAPSGDAASAPAGSPADGTSPSASVDAAAIGRTFVEALAGGDVAAAEAMEDPTMRAAAPAAALGQLWAQIVGQFGPYAGIGDVTTTAADPHVNAVVRARFGNATVPLIVTVTREGQVAGLHLGEPGPAESGGPASALPASPAASGPASPAAYVDPSRFTESEVTVGSDPWTLPGTLSMPVGVGPFPAVLLIAGSGPNDRDETIGPNTPLRDLAHGLASSGIAVLRYDKRTKAHGAAMATQPVITVREEVIDDAVAAVDLLRGTPGIDPDRVFVAGHSLGGYLAPRIAAAALGRVAGIAILDGSISPLQRLIEGQLAYLASDEGGADPQARVMLDALPAQVARVESADLSPETPASELPLGIPAAYWLDLRGYEPGVVARDLGIPILLVQGGRDYQVPPSELARWREALAGTPDVTVREYPALNHLLMAGEGPSRPAEYAVPGHVAAEVVADLASWVTSAVE